MPNVECKVIDPETGHVVPTGVAGEICTRGYSVMRGYWDEPALTAEAIDREGWMHTGDLAALDGQGYCNIVGRVKDMLIRGGENVYPAEIEDYLYRHPKVQTVQVFGVPDERLGEEVCAVVDCLVGSVPLDGPPIQLRAMQLDAERFADIHIFAAAEGDYALFLDASEQARNRTRFVTLAREEER